ncbi:MAG: hypothetical protein H7835_04325, partial [Magnetococcus sp. XQGC-1]
PGGGVGAEPPQCFLPFSSSAIALEEGVPLCPLLGTATSSVATRQKDWQQRATINVWERVPQGEPG